MHVCPECASRCSCFEGDQDEEDCVHDCETDDEMRDDVDELDFDEGSEFTDTMDDFLREDPA